MENKLTIFTPTYNRAYILPKLYVSLKSQTNLGFEWVIVDDGSSDNTEDLVKGWIEKNKIEIRYIYQSNGGKMKAHNKGVEETTTELFFCVDSDDWLVNDAVEKILNEWNSISEEDKTELSGIVAYRGKDSNNSIGNAFPKGVKKDSLNGLYKKGFSGDTSLIFRTKVIRRYRFPIIGNEKFITEAYVYNQVDREYKMWVMPTVLTVCEYRMDGLTQNLLKNTFNNPCGYVAYFLQQGNYTSSLLDTFKAYIRANSFRRYTKGVEMPVEADHKFIYVISRPFGWILFIYKKRLYCRNNSR